MFGYYQEYVIRYLAEEFLGRKLPIVAYVDSRSFIYIISKGGNTTEKRVKNDIFAICKSYADCEIERLGCIPGLTNPADALKKLSTYNSKPLSTFISTNKLDINPLGWASKVSTTRDKGSEEDDVDA